MFKLSKFSELSNHKKATVRTWSFIGIVLIVLLMGCCGLFPSNSIGMLRPLNGFVMWTALFSVAFCFINLLNKERIPGKKEFTNMEYINLLFTLGTGVGIMIFGFNEAPQLIAYEGVRDPIGLVLNHWTIIPWCIYTMFAVFEIYDTKYHLLPKWLEIFKTYVYGIMMMVGIATSFGLGVITISGSLEVIYGVTVPSYALVVLLGAAVTVSLMLGLHKGLKNFSKVSMWLFYVFIGVLALIAPPDSLQVGCKAVGSLFTDFFHNNVWDGRDIQVDWTAFYWIWWFSWCAFCAPFIVTISKGRTVRSAVFFTVVIPTILSAVYMILGNNIGMHLFNDGVEIGMLPYVAINKHWLIPVLFIVLMSMFYVTSSDSQSFTMDQLISKGSKTPVVYRKMIWVSLEVLFVTVLLLAGSGTIKAIQGLSFLFVPLLLVLAIIYVILMGKQLYVNYRDNGSIFNNTKEDAILNKEENKEKLVEEVKTLSETE